MVDCPENSTLGVCDLIDEAGTGTAVLVDRIGLPLGTFLIILAIAVGVGALISGVVFVIKNSITKRLR